MSIFDRISDYVIDGSQLRKSRQDKGLVQEDIAYNCDISVNAVSCYELNNYGINAVKFYKILLLIDPEAAQSISKYFKKVD